MVTISGGRHWLTPSNAINIGEEVIFSIRRSYGGKPTVMQCQKLTENEMKREAKGTLGHKVPDSTVMVEKGLGKGIKKINVRHYTHIHRYIVIQKQVEWGTYYEREEWSF